MRPPKKCALSEEGKVGLRILLEEGEGESDMKTCRDCEYCELWLAGPENELQEIGASCYAPSKWDDDIDPDLAFDGCEEFKPKVLVKETHSKRATYNAERSGATHRQVLAIVRNQAIENKRLNDRWEELKAWVHATIQSAHSNMFEGLLHKVEEKMNELEAKEK